MRITLAIWVLLLAACTDGIDPSTADNSELDPDFFNLGTFVAGQVESLQDVQLRKAVTVNEVREEQAVDSVDWNLELAPFAQSNIDRPALWDLYEVTTTDEADGYHRLRYTALDSSLFTKSLVVTKRNEEVTQIEITNRFESYVANTAQYLLWTPKHYLIDSEQKARLLAPRSLKIEGDW